MSKAPLTPAVPKYTPEQAKAIETRGVSIALSAGAGCGKTFVLTQRFLAGLEGSDANNLQSQVAITFTDKAAREMRDRIRLTCQQRLQHCSENDVDHWLSVLRGLDSARISTIHSFCAGLLRSQAVEAGLDPRFTVLEPALADTLLRNTAKRTLNGLLEQGDQDADDFVLTFGLEGSRELLRLLTTQRFQIVFQDLETETAEQIAQKWRLRWQTEFIPRLIADFRTSKKTSSIVELLREHQPNHATMQERRATLLQLLDPTFKWKDPVPTLNSIVEAGRVQGGGTAKSWSSTDVFEAVKDGLKDLREDAKKLIDTLPINEDDLQLSASFSVKALRLARLTAEAYEIAKKSQGVLDFDDLLLRARNLLRDREDVRQRVAASVRLLMVDEFQDTDPVQADIVQMLCGAALTLGRLFLVGDAKQSIYRFRRADPGVFDRLRQEIPEAGRLPLSTNFRSQPAILNFVNHLFIAGMPKSYEALKPIDLKQESPTPGIEFLFARFDADEVNPPARGLSAAMTPVTELSPWHHDHISAAELRSREADWIARRCAELLADTTPRIRAKDGKSSLRRTEPGDIVILFRALSNVQEYESALRKYGLDYYLVGGKAFFAQQEVFDLLNLCRYLDDPDDLIGLVGVLRSPFFNLSDDSIHAISTRQGLSKDPLTLHDRLMLDPPAHLSEEQQWRIRNAREILADLRLQKDRLPLSKLISHVIERTGYDAGLLTEYLGSRKVANLRKLVEMAHEFDQTELFTLKDFVQRLQTSVLEETDEEFATTLPETGKVIRLMSIHQSKGLEFPVVIVADIDRKGPPRSKSAVLHPDFGALVKIPETFGEPTENLGLKMFGMLEQEADAEESIRLFYVACTRAADYLILSAGIDPAAHKCSPWVALLQSRFHLDTGELKTDPFLGSSAGGTAGRENIPEVKSHSTPADIKKKSQTAEKVVPLNQLAELIMAAEPIELPPSAQRVPRDLTDLPPLSVSRLEVVDAKLQGIGHALPVRIQEPVTEMDEAPRDVDQATELGSLVHTVLQRIDFNKPDDWPSILKTVTQSSRDAIDPQSIASTEKLITRLLDSPIAADLATAKTLLREVEFVLRWVPPAGGHPLLIRGIIDVLYEDPDGGWHILDYKTNDFPAAASDELLLAPYEFQLGVYAQAVTEWFGVVPCELALIALRPSVRQIPLPWTSERKERIQARLHASIAACQTTEIHSV